MLEPHKAYCTRSRTYRMPAAAGRRGAARVPREPGTRPAGRAHAAHRHRRGGWRAMGMAHGHASCMPTRPLAWRVGWVCPCGPRPPTTSTTTCRAAAPHGYTVHTGIAASAVPPPAASRARPAAVPSPMPSPIACRVPSHAVSGESTVGRVVVSDTSAHSVAIPRPHPFLRSSITIHHPPSAHLAPSRPDARARPHE
jgi:hypothetical protein